MFIQTESTPNPATLKFLPGREVMGEGAVADFPTEESGSAFAAGAAPCSRCRKSPACSSAPTSFPSPSATATGSTSSPPILGTIMEHFTRGLPLIEGTAEERDDADYGEGDPEIVAQIKELIDTRVRPAVAQDGGDIIFKGFDGGAGIVFLHLQGSCAGCPSSTMTLKNGIENMLRHYVPEVNAVEAV